MLNYGVKLSGFDTTINPYIRRRRYMLVPTHLAKYTVRHTSHQNPSKFVYTLHETLFFDDVLLAF